MDTLIEITNLSKHFGSLTAVDGISFSVRRGEVLGFLGPNGAGKSTTMKMVTGFLTPSGGEMKVCGHNVLEETIQAQKRIGYLPEGAPLYPDMTPEGLFAFVAQIRGLYGAEQADRIADVVEKVHVANVLRQPIETLSKGYKRRVGLALAILHDPEVLVLDEPTDGLDPNQKAEVRSLIQQMASEKAILLSTHILEEVEAVCTRAIIIDRGKIVVDGTPEELEARSRFHNTVRLSLSNAPGGVVERLRSITGVASVEEKVHSNGNHGFRVIPKGGENLVASVSECIRENGWKLDELSVERGRLDDVFRMMTKSDVETTDVVQPVNAASGSQTSDEKEEVPA